MKAPTPAQIDRVVRKQQRWQQRKLVARMKPQTREEALRLFKMPLAELVKLSVEREKQSVREQLLSPELLPHLIEHIKREEAAHAN